MKRRWTIALLILLTAALATVAFKYWPRTVTDSQCSSYYRHYRHSDGIQATYIKGKRLNDTLRVDLTLLQATTPQGWQQLCRDFQLPAPDSATRTLLQEGNPDIVLSILSPTPVNYPDTVHIAAASRSLQCVSIFHTTSIQQFNTIVDNHIDQLQQ